MAFGWKCARRSQSISFSLSLSCSSCSSVCFSVHLHRYCFVCSEEMSTERVTNDARENECLTLVIVVNRRKEKESDVDMETVVDVLV